MALGISFSAAAEEYSFGDLGLPDDYVDTMVMTPDMLEWDAASLPAYFNWADLGMVTPAKNQGSCGSCWAFAVTGVMESKLLICGYGNYDLSEQQQVSCNTSCHGCNGGWLTAIRFWEKVGPMKENLTGYSASNQPASDIDIYDEIPVRVKGYYTVNTYNVNDVKQSLINDGPGAFRFTVHSDFVTFWNGGAPGTVYRNTAYNVLGGHAVMIIGWDDAKSAWLCKNSWGEHTGPNGDGSFWIHWNDHANYMGFGMANCQIEAPTSIAMCLPLDEVTDGQTTDLKERNDGIVVGTTAVVDGAEGSALNFTGSNYIRVPNDSSLNFGRNDFSITAWVRNTQTYGTILDKRASGKGGYHIMVYSGRLLLQMSDAQGHWQNIWSNTYINDNEWHMIGASVDRNSTTGGKLYVDGTCIYTFNPTGIPGSMDNDSDLLLGKHAFGGSAYVGDLDEFVIYSKALSADEMGKIYYSAGADLLKAALSGIQCLAAWDFENGDAHDTSGNGAHGILQGGTTVSAGSADFNGGTDVIEIPTAGDIAARIKPLAAGYKTVIMEARVYMDAPGQYYNTFFNDSAYMLGAHSLSSSNPRITWRMNNVRSVLGEGGGRWGSGPDLWSNKDVNSPAFYWGWELSSPMFGQAGQWINMKVKYDHEKDTVTSYLNEVELSEVALITHGPVMNPAPTAPAYIGRDSSGNSTYNFKGKIDYLRIYAK